MKWEVTLRDPTEGIIIEAHTFSEQDGWFEFRDDLAIVHMLPAHRVQSMKRVSPEARPLLRVSSTRYVLPEPGGEKVPNPESTEGGGRVSALKRQEGAPVLLG